MTSHGHVAYPRGGYKRGDVRMYIGGGVIFDLVRSRQRYLFAVVSPWKDSIGFMKVVVRYYTPCIYDIILIRFRKEERNTCLCRVRCCLLRVKKREIRV